jgi:hypothetical protein
LHILEETHFSSIFFIGTQWEIIGLVPQLYLLENLMSVQDFYNIFVVKNNREMMKRIYLAYAYFFEKKL